MSMLNNSEDIDSYPIPPKNNDEYAELFDENNQNGEAKSLLSLINDTLPRAPIDLIQADFPSTPSSIFGKHAAAAADAAANSNAAAQTAGSTQAGSNMSLDQTTKSLEQLYVSSELSPKTTPPSNAPPLSHYVVTAPNGSGGPASGPTGAAPAGGPPAGGRGAYYPNNANPGPTTGAADPMAAFNAAAGPIPNGGAGGNVLGGPISKNFGANKGGAAGPAGGPNNGTGNYNSLLGNNPSQILNNGLNPLTPAVAMGAGAGGAGSSNPQHQSAAAQAAQQASQPYYVQQAVFLDQNGQPMYYRPVTNQFGQEFTYVTAADGSTHLAPAGGHMGNDPNSMQSAMQQSAFMQFPPGTTMTPITNSQGMPTGYWTTAPTSGSGSTPGPSGMGPEQQGSMYMNPGHPQQVAMGGMMDGQRRMVYNPATGQYNQIPAMSGQSGSQGGSGRNNLLPGGPGSLSGNNNMNMPALLPRNAMNGGMNEIDSLYGMMDSRGGNYLDYVSRMNRERDNGFGSRDMRDLRRDNRDGGGMRDRGNDRNNRNAGNPSSNGVNPVRDSLVDDFRNTYGKSRQWGLRDLLGHVVAFCQDQHGSRFIQQRLEVCSDVDKQLIFDEIIPAAPSLMTDVFGNYVLQKLFEYGTPDQCESLAILLKGQAVQLAMQMYGCRVVQKALEYVNTPRLIELVSEFESPPLLLRCVHDSNGNHVIQKCIEIVSRVAKEAATPEAAEYLSSRIQFIIDAFRGKVKELSSHPYGCRVVQRILEHCSNNQKAVILEELRQCCTELVQDCYGNYVIQFVMQHGWEADRQVLIREVQANLLEFSQHKFASNVVEKCLQFASKKDRDEMIWTIINVTFDLKNPVDAKGHCVLESMVRDPYANYVVQKVIDVSDERQRAAIMRYVKENITQLRRYTYGKHIIVRLEKITNEKF